jgi:hypothetical protein
MTDLNKLIISTTVFFTLLSSCTMRVPCDNGNIKLGFVAFSDTATNSVIIRQFKKTSGFKTLVDTVLITDTSSSYKKYYDTLQVEYSFNKKHGYTSSNYGLTSEHDYEIYLPAIDKTFQISDIDEEYEMQKKGFTSDNSSCYNYIKSYSINGQKIIGEFTNLTVYFHH